MDKFYFDDFPAEKKTKFSKRVNCVSLFNSNGTLINLHSGKAMSLTVYPVYENGLRTRGYVGYFEDDKNDAIVVVMPGEYFTVETA